MQLLRGVNSLLTGRICLLGGTALLRVEVHVRGGGGGVLDEGLDEDRGAALFAFLSAGGHLLVKEGNYSIPP